MSWKAIPVVVVVLALGAGCAGNQPYGSGPTYGTTGYGATAASPAYGVQSNVAYRGRIVDIDSFPVERGYKFGVGSVIGAVAGGLLGNQIGEGAGKTAATIAGAAAGGAAGTAAESRINTETASRITVDLDGGGVVTVVQPYDERLREGMRATIVGQGDAARVVLN
jgi:outer membrane lipoprotein SlyB